MPRVSILLPTHNRADVLELALQSVLDQTEMDFELLVVADGCTDGTLPLVAGIGDPRIRLFDLPKAPAFGYANRNIALREASGEYIAFAAHDDLLLPDHLRLLIDCLDATGREWAYSRPLWVSSDGTIVPFATNLTNADELRDFMTVANTIPASCVVYRRSCLDRYGYGPEDVSSALDCHHRRRPLGEPRLPRHSNQSAFQRRLEAFTTLGG
jgi:glycosyltransferase involved in cell wall biosynthesis